MAYSPHTEPVVKKSCPLAQCRCAPRSRYEVASALIEHSDAGTPVAATARESAEATVAEAVGVEYASAKWNAYFALVGIRAGFCKGRIAQMMQLHIFVTAPP